MYVCISKYNATSQLLIQFVTRPTEQCQSLCRTSERPYKYSNLHTNGPTGFTVRVSDSRQEVSLNPEGPATGQLDQGFPWFYSILELMMSHYPKSTSQWMIFTEPSPKWTANFSAKRHARSTFNHNAALQTQNATHHARSTLNHNAALQTQNATQINT